MEEIYTYKNKQCSGLFNVLYVVSECQNSSQCSGVEYHQTFMCPIYSFSQVHTVHIPCLCSVNNMSVLLHINHVFEKLHKPKQRVINAPVCVQMAEVTC